MIHLKLPDKRSNRSASNEAPTGGISIDDLIAKKLQSKSAFDSGPDVRILKRFECPDSQYWFIRFAFDPSYKWLACGSIRGDITLCDFGTRDPEYIESITIPVHKMVKNKIVRQIAFNESGTVMVAVTDGCFVLKYSIKRDERFVEPGRARASRQNYHHVRK